MKLPLRIAAGGLALLAIALIALQDLKDPSPGPLSPTHERVVELRGADGCVRCHGDGPADLAPSCLDCHEPIQQQIQNGVALHGGLEAERQQDCGACHAEHVVSPASDLVAFSFRLADMEEPEAFRHETLDFQLDGRHDELACMDCHEAADVEALPAEVPRFLGKTQDCTSCHEDPHKGTMERSCASCHGQEHPFDDLTAFPHVKEIPLHGSHAQLDCRECHKQGDPYSVEALSDPEAALPWRTCSGCHENPHTPSFVQKQPALPLEFAKGQDACALCHSEEHTTFYDDAIPWKDSWHESSGFSLTSPHAELACTECHGERASEPDFATRYPGRLEKECSSCHEDPHEGQFLRAPYLEEDCRSCHASDTFAKHQFTLQRHADQGYPLLGAHKEAACDTCHEAESPEKPFSWSFHGTTERCDQCHTDVHEPPFAMERLKQPQSSEGDCATCHQATHFRDLVQEFDHGFWTDFPLTQGHAQLDCEACHAGNARDLAQGRQLGLVAHLFPGEPSSCEGCHEDTHLGVFDTSERPETLADQQGCARCHGTESFRAIKPKTFDHDMWTDYPLTGAHGQISCEDCHGRDPSNQSLGKVTDAHPGDWKQCSTCHSDPHAGAFNDPNFKPKIFDREGCFRCHTTTSFRQLQPGAFDHGYWTGFELKGAHQTTDCTSCHAVQAVDAGQIRLGKTSGSRCTDCHTDPHAGQFLNTPKQDCLSCHDRGIQGFELPDFDHNRLTRFQLDPTHAALECASCHKPETTASGQAVVRYVPLGTQCVDCHAVTPPSPGGR